MSTPKILMVDDQEVDLKLLSWGFQKCRRSTDVTAALSGAEGWALLQGGESFDLILLDINMPGMNGREFLKTLRSDPQHAATVVVMFTSSAADSDVRECYGLGANGYICKPESPAAITSTLEDLLHFWFDVCKLPDRTMTQY